MQNFINTIFPSNLTYGIEFTPEYQTEIVTTSSGVELRKQILKKQRKRFHLAPLQHNYKEAQNLINFFHLMKGRLHSFRFDDILDNQMHRSKIAVGSGTQKKFQIMKAYEYGNHTLFEKIIFCPRIDSVKVYVGGKKANNYSVLDGGIIEFSRAPRKNKLIEVSCEFDTVVRFDNDHLKLSLEKKDLFYIEDIKLIEVLTN